MAKNSPPKGMGQKSNKRGSLNRPVNKIAKTYKSAVMAPVTAVRATGKFLYDPTGYRASRRKIEIDRKGKRPPTQSYNPSNAVQKKADAMGYAEKSKRNNSPSASTRRKTAESALIKEFGRKGASQSVRTLTPKREREIESQYPKRKTKKTNKK